MKTLGAEESIIKFLPRLIYKNVGMSISVGGSSAKAQYELRFCI